MIDPLETEIVKANTVSRMMIKSYVEWGPKIKVGESMFVMYNELIDFVNFRIETAETCLLLIDDDRIADALGLCRSLLENYLLHILRCRGYRSFRLSDRSDLTEGQFKEHLRNEQQKFQEAKDRGEALYVAVSRYPRAKRHVMYVYEGKTASGEPDLMIPDHYFSFEQFNPEFMRLDKKDYFEYMPLDAGTKKRLDEARREVALVYRHRLSYEALLQYLELNNIADEAASKRIEAHYTFLGRFLHPTHDAARNLRERGNYYEGRPAVGLSQPYKKDARLLASLYVCYLIAGLLDEIALLHEKAPKRYIADAGTGDLRGITSKVPDMFPYFWFLFNKPPLYDKFNYGGHHVSGERLKEIGGYFNLPDGEIPFDQDVYGHLGRALSSWSRPGFDQYVSPLLAQSL